MKNKFLGIVLTVLFLCLFITPANAILAPDFEGHFYSKMPAGYDDTNPILVAYFERQSKEKKVELALDMLKTAYPDWNASYKEGCFDCSEMSEMVRWWMGKCGIPAVLSINTRLNHVWVEADGVIIEATNLCVVSKKDKRDWYYSEGVSCDVRLPIWEIDWWNWEDI